jgi:hypothetical protein
MIGLMFLLVLIPYCVLVLWLTIKGMNIGRKKFGNQTSQARRKVYAYGFAGFAIATVPVFWEAIPTYIVYKDAVRDEAGLKIYKTFEQWKLENPTVTSNFLGARGTGVVRTPEGVLRYPLNLRISIDLIEFKRPFAVVVYKQNLVDLKTNEVLSEFTYVRSGNHGGLATGGDGWWKFWLIRSSETDDPSSLETWNRAIQNFNGKEITK